MKTQQLMIGDWVLRDGEPYQIRQLGIYGVDRDGEDYPAVCVGKPKGIGLIIERNEIDPIPLTVEILEKNGFKFKQQGSLEVAILKIKNRHPITLEYIGWSDGRWSIHEHRLVVKYVHELQHVFRLCGIEKEIKL